MICIGTWYKDPIIVWASDVFKFLHAEQEKVILGQTDMGITQLVFVLETTKLLRLARDNLA